jgi:hypothetical protein
MCMDTITNPKGDTMKSCKIERTQIKKAYTTVVNTLYGNEIKDEWDVPTVEDAWQWGSEYALVRLTDGNVYRVRLELTNNGYTI